MDTFSNNGESPIEREKIYQDLLHIIQGDHQGDHQWAAANISAIQSLSEPVGGSPSTPKRIEIKVELSGRLTNKKTQYKFRVDPTDKVSVLRILLVNKEAQLPHGYLFATGAAVLNEEKSFLDQGMMGVGVPKLYVLDCVSNF